MVGYDLKGKINMARLDSLSVSGFKSIREMDSLPLTKLNLLIGANGSGKSNFLELFKLLRASMQLPLPGFKDTDLKKYVLDSGVAADFLYKGKPEATQIYFKLDFGVNGYRMVLVPTQDDLLRIDSEGTYYKDMNHWYNLHSPDGFTPALLADKDTEGVFSKHGVGYYVYESIKNWQMYHFHDTGRLSPIKSSQNVFDYGYLRFDGSNLASYLLYLKGHPYHSFFYSQIVAAVRQVAPFFDDFILEANPQDLVRLLWKQKGSDYPMKPQLLSDGTLRFICLATVLLQPKHPDTIIIDEPELGLHPYAIGLLAELMQARSTDTQLIVATQSPALISHFEPEDIIVCDRMEGQSTFTRLNSNSLDVWLEDYSLGELWTKNILSGGPIHE
ncbi:MAG: AAA family ATPase [Sphaerochaeta sp.]|nr:AAA family ATPase [Sphaerochaeta sp.]